MRHALSEVSHEQGECLGYSGLSDVWVTPFRTTKLKPAIPRRHIRNSFTEFSLCETDERIIIDITYLPYHHP
jgi:hypothetical protein